MPESELTLNQQLACDIRRNLYVCAGAGSGKTEVLTRRVIHILKQRQLELSQILVVTFTDKAAGQMRARVYQAIHKQISQNDEHPAYWLKLKENFYLNHISTFHSFCASILREYALEAGIDPDFSILNEHEQQDLLGNVVNKEINRLASDFSSSDLNRLNRVWRRGVIVANLIRLIESRSQSQEWLHRFPALSLKQYMANLKGYQQQAISEQINDINNSAAFWEHLDTVYGLIRQMDKKTPSETERLAEIGAIYPRLKNMTRLSTEEGLEVLAKLREQLNLRGIRHSQLKQSLGSLRELLNDSDIFDYTISPAIECEGYGLLSALANLGRQCLHSYQKQKQNNASLDFEDLQLLTLDLLKSKKHPHILSELRSRFSYIMVDEFQDTNPLQWQILKMLASDEQGLEGDKLFMVGDEKQSIYAFRGADVTVFAKAQALLRQANIDRNTHQLPFKLPEEYATGYNRLSDIKRNRLLHGEITLEHNFRSAYGLVDFLNSFFERLFKRERYRLYDARSKSQVARRESAGAHVELMLVEKEKAGSPSPQDRDPIDNYLKEAHLIAKKIKHIQTARPVEYKGVLDRIDRREPAIAILLGRRNKLKIYEDALRREDIDFLVSKGRGFYQRQEIIDIVNALEFINQPQLDIPLAGVLRSPLIGLSDDGLLALTSFKGNSLWDKLCMCFKAGMPIDQSAGFLEDDIRLLPQAFQLMRSWIGLKNRLPLSELINKILDDSQLYICLAQGQRGAQNIANIEKFIELARNFETSGRGGIWEWVNYLRDRLSDDVEGEAEVEPTMGGIVQLMTIHQAKGLEFPMAIVPDLSYNFQNRKKNLLMDSLNHGKESFFEMGIKAPDPEDRLKPQPTLIRKIIVKRQQQKNLAEKRRLLYVAATRARDHLILVGQLSHKPPSHTKCSMDWIKDILDVDLSLQPRVASITNHQAKQIDIPITLFDPDEEISPHHEPPIITPKEIDRQVEQLAPSPKSDYIIRQLEPPPIIERPVFSPTSLLEYRRCPRHYYYQHHLGIPEWACGGGQAPFSDAKQKTVSNPAALRGTIVHGLLEDGVFQDSSIEAVVNKEEGLSDEQKQKLSKDVKRHIENIINTPTYNSWRKLGQSYQELQFKIRLGDFYFQGIIDQLHFDPKLDKWVVVDYKTNELEDEAEIEAEIKREDYDFQLQCYCLAAGQLLEQPVSTAYLFFSHFPRLKELNFTPDTLKSFYTEIEKLGHKIMRHEFAPLPQDKQQCKNCSYQSLNRCSPC